MLFVQKKCHITQNMFEEGVRREGLGNYHHAIVDTNTHKQKKMSDATTPVYSVQVTTVHNPYTVNTNFTTKMQPMLRPMIDGLTKEYRVLKVSKCPTAKLPKYDTLADGNYHVMGCTRVFIGGTSYSSGVGVAEALIRLTDCTADPTRIVKVNFTKPHYNIDVGGSHEAYQQVRDLMQAKGYYLLPLDKHEVELQQRGTYRVKVGLSSYRLASATPRTIDLVLLEAFGNSSQLQAPLPLDGCSPPFQQHGAFGWKVTKNTGGIQLVMLPHHAERLLQMSQCVLQDTDDSLIVALTPSSRQTINELLKEFARWQPDSARLMCAPMRFVSIEDKGSESNNHKAPRTRC